MLDLLERELFPEIHRHSKVDPETVASILNGTDEDKVILDFMRKTAIELPLQWENLEEEKMDLPGEIGHPDEQHLPDNRIHEILVFYREAIPLVADPQKKLRYGATAMKLWRLAKDRQRSRDEGHGLETRERFDRPHRGIHRRTLACRDVTGDRALDVHRCSLNFGVVPVNDADGNPMPIFQNMNSRQLVQAFTEDFPLRAPLG